MSNAHSKQPPIKSQYKNIKIAQLLLSGSVNSKIITTDKPQAISDIFNQVSILLKLESHE